MNQLVMRVLFKGPGGGVLVGKGDHLWRIELISPGFRHCAHLHIHVPSYSSPPIMYVAQSKKNVLGSLYNILMKIVLVTVSKTRSVGLIMLVFSRYYPSFGGWERRTCGSDCQAKPGTTLERSDTVASVAFSDRPL